MEKVVSLTSPVPVFWLRSGDPLDGRLLALLALGGLLIGRARILFHCAIRDESPGFCTLVHFACHVSSPPFWNELCRDRRFPVLLSQLLIKIWYTLSMAQPEEILRP